MVKPRAYIGDFTIRCGSILSTRGRLLPLRQSAPPRPKYCTPDGKPVTQVYRDEAGGLWSIDQLGRATADKDGNLTLINTEAVEQAKTSDLTLNTLNLTVHKADEVDGQIFPEKSNAYVFDPTIKVNRKIINDPDNVEAHDFLNFLVNDSGFAFMGKCNFNNYEGLYKLSSYKGHILVQKYLFPHEMNEYDQLAVTVDRADKAKLLKIMDVVAQPFDPESYENVVTQRLQEAMETPYDPQHVTEERPTQSPGLDLDAVLEAALAEFA
jgi:hypothetical protein